MTAVATLARLEGKSESEQEQITEQFLKCLVIKDRRWRFKVYKQCFVGRDAIDAMVKTKLCKTREEAVKLGNELLIAGVFKHVVEDHLFEDGYFFYRVVPKPSVASPKTETKRLEQKVVNPAELAALLRLNVGVKDRRYRLKTFKQCFVGSEAIDYMIKERLAVNREDGVNQGNLLLRAGLIRHCLRRHVFKDKQLFYVFESAEASQAESAFTLQALLRDQVGADAFEEHARKSFNAESVLFWRAVFEYSSQHNKFKTKSDAFKAALAIWNKFLLPGCEYQVNVSQGMRDSLEMLFDPRPIDGSKSTVTLDALFPRSRMQDALRRKKKKQRENLQLPAGGSSAGLPRIGSSNDVKDKDKDKDKEPQQQKLAADKTISLANLNAISDKGSSPSNSPRTDTNSNTSSNSPRIIDSKAIPVPMSEQKKRSPSTALSSLNLSLPVASPIISVSPDTTPTTFAIANTIFATAFGPVTTKEVNPAIGHTKQASSISLIRPSSANTLNRQNTVTSKQQAVTEQGSSPNLLGVDLEEDDSDAYSNSEDDEEGSGSGPSGSSNTMSSRPPGMDGLTLDDDELGSFMGSPASPRGLSASTASSYGLGSPRSSGAGSTRGDSKDGLGSSSMNSSVNAGTPALSTSNNNEPMFAMEGTSSQNEITLELRPEAELRGKDLFYALTHLERRNLFNQVQAEVYRLMRNNLYQSFIKSDSYREVLKTKTRARR